MYGLDANIPIPPFPAIISILLVAACDYVGLKFIGKVLKVDTIDVGWIRWQAPVIGVALLSILIYPMALFGFAQRDQLAPIAILLMIVGSIHIYRWVIYESESLVKSIYKINQIYISGDILSPIFIALILGYALFSLAPITNADSLDYHIGVPIEVLNTGFIHGTPEWFHSRLSGNGEAINALGLSVGAEQFGALLQFVGLLGIVGLIIRPEKQHCKKTKTGEGDIILILALLILSTPVLIFLVGSSKFQLLPISMTTLALTLTVYPSRRNLSRGDALNGFFLVCILVMVASQAKLNYLLSGGVVGLIALIVMFRRNLIWPSITIGIVTALIVLVPVMVIKAGQYGSGYIEALLSPLPGNFTGKEFFENGIRAGRDSNIIFPLSLIIPSGISTVTSIIGVGVFSIVFLKPNKDNWLIVLMLASIVVLWVTIILGPKSSRSYLEPYFWILITISLQNNNNLFYKYKRYIVPIVIIQSVAVISLCWYGVITMFPGAFTPSWREDVMRDKANGYTLMKWVDATLPQDAVVLTAHRSMALAPRRAVSLDWLHYIEVGGEDVSVYLNRIKQENITHLLVIGESVDQSGEYRVFANCLGGKVYGPGYGAIATRNPFNSGPTYKAWIVEFRPQKLPGCFAS